MVSNVEVGGVPRRTAWIGRIVTGLPALFLLVDGVAKLFKPLPVVKGTVKLGYSESTIIPIGIVLIVCTVLYLVPRTAVLGAILLTGYLGGAVATHVRIHDIKGIAPVVIGIIVWLGIYLREPRLRQIVFWR